MLNCIGRAARNHCVEGVWSNVYGTTRSILALSTLVTLVATPIDILLLPNTINNNFCLAGKSVGFFCVFRGHLEFARWSAIFILAVVASGWRPRLTALPHWIVSLSVALNVALVDGGDQVVSALTFLMLPLALTDPRQWHWSAPPTTRNAVARVVAHSSYIATKIQIAGIYFHAAVGKSSREEWIDGTALYYWMSDPEFGAANWCRGVVTRLLTHGCIVATVTWGTILLEFTLFAALFMSNGFKPYLLAIGIAFHISIFLLQGISSFSFAMVGALVLYLRPVAQPFALGRPGYLSQNISRHNFFQPSQFVRGSLE